MCDTEHPVNFTVEVDRDVQSIVPEFLENRRKDCLLITRLLQEGAYSEIRTLGHRMKGAGGSFGFDAISEIGGIVEAAALAADDKAIQTAVQRLSDYLERVVVVYA